MGDAVLTALGPGALAAMIAAGEVASREVVDAHIDRIDVVDPALNAVTVRLYDRARAAAAAADEVIAAGDPVGPLHGVPISVKDQFLLEGTPSTWGLPSRADHRATREGPLLHRLRAAGAIPLVKSNVPVLLLETETHNPLFGRTNNPWDLDRTPGGSSGGESALIAARCSPLGIGADIGGSLRIPAHYTGISSIKCTAHRLPWGDNPVGAFPEWQEAIVPVAGPMARTVDDVALGWRVLAAGDDPLAPEPEVPPVPWRDPGEVDVAGLRVGVYETDTFFAVAPAIRRAVREAAAALADAGAAVEEWSPPDPEEVFALYAGLLGCDDWQHVRDFLGDDPASPVLKLMFLGGRTPGVLSRVVPGAARALGQDSAVSVLANLGPASPYDTSERVIRQRALKHDIAGRLHDGPAVILGPPSALPALPHGRFRDLIAAFVQTFLPNLLGLPAGVVPVTRVRPDEETERSPGVDVVQRIARSAERGSAGLPVGVQVMAPWWREELVLAAMGAIEARVAGVGAPPERG